MLVIIFNKLLIFASSLINITNLAKLIETNKHLNPQNTSNMTQDIDKINSVAIAIATAFNGASEYAAKAMKTLELMDITPERYSQASEDIMLQSLVNAHLRRVAEVVNSGDIKKVERVMRFHAYQLREKGSIGGSGVIARAQLETAVILESLVNRFFED